MGAIADRLLIRTGMKEIDRRSRVLGCVLGAAIGDAMGHPTEFISSFEKIRERYGPKGVTGYELYWEHEGKRFAPVTDDSQMSEAVLRGLLDGRDQGTDLDGTMKLIAKQFIEWKNNPMGGHRAPGNACLDGCSALERGVPWREAGGPTAGGCGSVMRCYPFGLVFADDLEKAELWSVEHSKMTHGDPIALAACAAMAVGVVHVLHEEPVERVIEEMLSAAGRYSEPTAKMMEQAVGEGRTRVEPEVSLDRLRGWAAHEAISAAVYIFVRHPDDPRAAILEGANTPGDSDSIATLVGGLVGARCGAESIPASWVEELERKKELHSLSHSVQLGT